MLVVKVHCTCMANNIALNYNHNMINQFYTFIMCAIIMSNFFSLHFLVATAYSGRYCEEDRDGCSAVQCYVESSCHDIPAPGVGAECGPCPAGFTGNGIKCLGNVKCNIKSKLALA